MRFILLLFFVASCSSVWSQNLKLEHIRTFNGHAHGVRHVVFAPDGGTFASGGTRGELFIWDIEGAKAVRKLEGHFGSITDVRFSNDGRYLVSSGEDGQIKVWDISTGFCLQRVISPAAEDSPINYVNFALLSTENNSIYFGGKNRYVCRSTFKGDENPEVLYKDAKNEIRCAILSPDGKELIFASGAFLLALDLVTNTIIREYNTGNCTINALEFSSDGKRLLTWCENSRVDIRDPASFYLQTSFRSGTGGRKFSNLAFTDDQKYVITGDHASRFNVWDLNNKQRVLDQGVEQGTVMSFDLENGSNYVLSGSLDKSIKLWRIVEDVVAETKKKNKQPQPEESVGPEVEIVQYAVAVEDVPQKKGTGPVSMNVAIEQPEKVETYTPVVEPTKTYAKPITGQLPERKYNRRIKPIRKEHRLTFMKHQLTFDLWDAQVIDGDIVSIYVEDDCIVSEYSITASKKTVSYDASRFDRVYVYLHAHNLGTIPPNTVTMRVSDGEQEYQVELRSDMTGSSALELTFIKADE